jgi:hypothetical protein
MNEQQEQLATRFADQIITCAEIRIVPQDVDEAVGIVRPVWVDECRGVEFVTTPKKVEQPDAIDITIIPRVTKQNVTGTRFNLGKVMGVFEHCLTIHAISKGEKSNSPIVEMVGMYEGAMIRLYLCQSPETMEGLEVLVLCKRELFYQTATGDTLLTEYPYEVEAAKRRAIQLGVSLMDDAGNLLL